MSSGGKGSSAQQSKNYYGDLWIPVGWGPWDFLQGVILNGNWIFNGSLTLTADVTDLTGSLLDPTLVRTGGSLKFIRGTETQPVMISGHPPYLGTAGLLATGIFFGQNSGTAPNMQAIGGRLPRVSTALVASADNILDDGQVNPFAFIAEFLIDERGANRNIAEFDAATWLTAAHWCAQDQAHRDYTFISPSISEQSSVRDILKRILDPFGGYIRRNTKTGKLQAMIYEWGVDPGGLTTFDARHFTRKPKFDLVDWTSVPTEIMVSFTNRDYEWQNDTVLIPNARAQQIRQVDDPKNIDRKDVMRSAQAHKHGVEYTRRLSSGPCKGTLYLRNPFVDSLQVGDKIRADVDPEPGGSGLSQLCRVDRIEQDRTDEAVVSVTTDCLLPATPYTPTFPTTIPGTPSCATLAHYLAVPLPPAYFGWPLAVGIIATRPDTSIIGMEVFFSDTSSGSFDDLGQQLGFAVRCQLAAGITNVATSLQLTELDGVSGPDANLSADTPGGNAQAAQNNTLLILLAQLDSNGRISLDGSGDPIMEFISVSDRSLVSGATFAYTVLRGRMDTPALAWSSGAVAWVFPSANIMEWRPDHLEALYGSVAYWRLVAYNSKASDTNPTIPECSVNMIPVTSPMYQRGIQGGNSANVQVYQRAASAPSLPSATCTYTFATAGITGLNNGWSATIPPGSNPLYTTTAPAFSNGPTTSILPAEWSAAVILAQDGSPGATGPAGPTGPAGTWGGGSITTVMIANGAVGNISSSYTAGPGTITNDGTGTTEIHVQGVSITVDSNPVQLNNSFVVQSTDYTLSGAMKVRVKRDGSTIYETPWGFVGVLGYVQSAQALMDTPGPGAHTYDTYVILASIAPSGAQLSCASMVVLEMKR